MWIEVFKAGKHKDSKGKAHSFSEADIQSIANSYNSKIDQDLSYEAPIVKGHPKNDDPAYGWVERLKAKGELLLAKIKNIVPEFKKEIEEGRFKKVSLALYPDNMLRHIGFLGAMAPAVKGLKSVSFSDEVHNEIEYEAEKNDKKEMESEIIRLKQKIDELLFNQKRKEFSDYVNSLTQAGKEKINAKQSEIIMSIYDMLSDRNKEFSEDKGLEIIELLKEFAESNQFFSELYENSDIGDYMNIDKEEFSGKNIDPERLSLHKKARQILNENKDINYEQALIMAINQ